MPINDRVKRATESRPVAERIRHTIAPADAGLNTES
jgi:hypothetical protein